MHTGRWLSLEGTVFSVSFEINAMHECKYIMLGNLGAHFRRCRHKESNKQVPIFFRSTTTSAGDDKPEKIK